MKTYIVTVKREFNATPDSVYKVISNMENHRQILPKEFKSFVVEKGGVGEGTVVSITMKILGIKVCNVLKISEPEPGKVLKETDETAGVVTVWRVMPLEKGKRSLLFLTSIFRCRKGIAGIIERKFNPLFIKSIYRRELEQLNQYLQSQDQ